MSDPRPIVAITMGDPAGVGLEVIAKSFARPEIHSQVRALVVGNRRRIEKAARVAGVTLEVRAIETPRGASWQPGIVPCIEAATVPDELPFGKLSPVAGEAAYRCIRRAVDLDARGDVAAVCTPPLNKEAHHAAGHRNPGHTELLAHLTHTPEVSMMLLAENLRVIHVTTHIGLIDAIRKIDAALVERTIARAHALLVAIGIPNPRIAVCGINPHAGESGLFGQGEEAEKIDPAIARCRARGWDVQGALPADTLFFRARRGDFDMVVAMYHDQGHGPVKVLGLEAGVNVTVGLPFVRTSVDHGTAFDIAGTGVADERSLLEALRQAAVLSPKT
jgi:4-hydroxythreonine-4-phosphate dehydrogenase